MRSSEFFFVLEFNTLMSQRPLESGEANGISTLSKIEICSIVSKNGPSTPSSVLAYLVKLSIIFKLSGFK